MDELSWELRMALSQTIRRARAARRWTQEELSTEAEAALRRAAAEEGAEPLAGLWANVDVTNRHVGYLENGPAYPLSTPERRARLLGVTLALGLDRGEINRLAGGI